jgi:hypothetical protein
MMPHQRIGFTLATHSTSIVEYDYFILPAILDRAFQGVP